MANFFVFLISFFIAFSSFAADKPVKRNILAMPAQMPIKSWQPIPFSIDIENLPPNYEGNDPVKFFEIFKSKISSIKKGDFETTEEFTQRTANKDLLLSPISIKDFYAFRISDIFVKYDADGQAYLLGGGLRYSCRRTLSKDWFTCKMTQLNRVSDTYVGSNSFGASRTIDRIRGHDLSLAFSKSSPVLGTALELLEENEYVFRDRVSFPLEKAKEIKDKKIGVLFVGRVLDPQIIDGRGITVIPKMSSPTDISITEEAIPFELKRIIYFVFETGQIIGGRIYD